MARRQYSNTATEATLTGGVASADTSFILTSFAGFPAVPFTATISRGESDEEVVLITAVSSSTVTATRGYDGTAAKAHSAGATFTHTTVAKDYDEANAHVNTSAGVHGLAGSVVGTTDTQTLTNKTLTSPTLAGAVNTGTTTMVNAALSGTLSVSGATTLAALAATDGSFSGNASVGGTLSVTGASTLTGALAANGGVTTTTVTATGLVKGAGLESTAALTLAQVTAPAGAASKQTVWAQSDGGLYTRSGTGTVVRSSVHWGTGTTFPAGALAGDTFFYTGVCLFRYNGSTWRQAETCEVATKAARDALPTAPLHAGFRVYQSDFGWEWIYTGSAWNYDRSLGVAPKWTGVVAWGYDGAGTRTVVFGAANADTTHGLVTNNTTTGVLTINANAKISATALQWSDSGSPRWAHFVMTMPGALGSPGFNTWEDFREAPAGYGSGGSLRQAVGGSGWASAGDTIALTFNSLVSTSATSFLTITFL